MTQSFLFDTDPEPVATVPGYPCAFSPDRVYRYCLWRLWQNIAAPRYVLWIMLNPSTADEDDLDPTLKRCVQFSKDWGFDGLCVCNLFAFRATKPEDMKAAADPVGDDCDYWIAKVAADAAIVVAGWGVDGAFLQRDRQMKLLIPELHCLALTKDGHPQHPLFTKGTLRAMAFSKRPASLETDE